LPRHVMPIFSVSDWRKFEDCSGTAVPTVWSTNNFFRQKDCQTTQGLEKVAERRYVYLAGDDFLNDI
jgi:hypothetical protein